MSMKPSNKVGAGALAGAITAILTWCAQAFGQVTVPAEIGIAASTVITFIVQWVVPDAQHEQEHADTRPQQGIMS